MGAGEREPTEEEKHLFPGLVGLVPPTADDMPDVHTGVPKPILDKIKDVEAQRRQRGMHGEGLAQDELAGVACLLGMPLE